MVEGGEVAPPATAAARNSQPVTCQECGVNPPKYKCPGCSLRSCSLSCVNSHKQRTSCNGKRNLSQSIPLSQFDDNLLLSDYNLLEEMKRLADSAKRRRTELCGYSGFTGFKLPFFLHSLQKAASSRRTKLLFLPRGMSKRERNQSRLDQRAKVIYWTIEWRFHSTDAVLYDHGVHEDTNLCTVISKHVQPGPWNHQLRQFCDEQLDHLKFFVRNYAQGPKTSFQELDINAPLRKQLANLVMLEYPVISVFLPSHKCDFEIVRAPNPVINSRASADAAINDSSSIKGVYFKEEEIQDTGNLEPQVYDLTTHVKSNQHKQDQDPILERDATGDQLQNANAVEPGPDFAMEFDFDQGLMDAYSDIIAQINPDEFLDLDGENEGALFMADDLEEGEIME